MITKVFSESDLVAVLRDVVGPCLTASVRRGELKRGEVEDLTFGWRDHRLGSRKGSALVLSLSIRGQTFTFNVVDADRVDSYDAKAVADRLEERLEVFIADVIGRPTRSDFR